MQNYELMRVKHFATIMDFINIFHRRDTKFHSQATHSKRFELNFVMNRETSSMWSNQVGKVILTEGQFVWWPALHEMLNSYDYQ